jgi:hypothetical protein
MSKQNTTGAEKASELETYHRSIQRLPVTLRPSLNQQLAQWGMLFPFEQKQLIGFLGGLDSFSSAALTALTAKLRALEVRMGVDRWNFSETSDTLENASHLARSEYFAEWRGEVQRIFEAIVARAQASAKTDPERNRLILLFLPDNLPVDPTTAWKQWDPQGREIRIAGDSRKLRDLVARGQSDQPGIYDLLDQKGSHDSANLWFIEADARLRDALAPTSVPAASCLSYTVLKPFRNSFLVELNSIPKDMTATDQTVSALREKDWTRWWPSELAGQERLRNFTVNLFLSGNGALIFSNAFVEWAASEALRRARPQAIVACFGMRSKPKPFTGIALFENQERISPLPDVDDPENSAVDAAILARYVWLAAGRYPEYNRAACLCVSEHLNTAYIVAPPEMNLGTSGAPVAPEDIYRWIASWLAS